MASWFDRIVSWFFPRIILSGTPWQDIWEAQERDSFVSAARLFFPFVALAYIGHYHFFDVPMGLEPTGNWFFFRYGTAFISLAIAAYYFTPWVSSPRYKIAAVIGCTFYCIAQAKVAISYGNEAWVFCFALLVMGAQVLREPVGTSLLFALAVIGAMTPSLIEAQTPIAKIVSGSMVTFVTIVALRSSYIKDVHNFLLSKENLASQQQLVELNRDFTDRIRSFIPNVISDRLENFVSNNQMSVIEASIEVLRAEEKTVSCLFSDIRGYTANSKNLESYIRQSVIPEMRVCSSIIENNEGIPRKIGDLLFAYFDHPNSDVNTMRAIMSGIEISKANVAMNTTGGDENVDRYILISTGEAIVGNIGGIDSSVEITALGSPVNFLSRLDEFTKSPALSKKLRFGDIVICEHTAKAIFSIAPRLKKDLVEIGESDGAIRDFPEVKSVFVVKPTDENLDIIREAIEHHEVSNTDERHSRFRKIA